VEADPLVAGRYRLRERLGAGGNAVVWLAVDEKLNRPVAMKRALVGDPRGGSARVRRLRREAEILAGLHHPNIVTLLDVEPDGDSVWLVMEYVKLRSLAEQGILAVEQLCVQILEQRQHHPLLGAEVIVDLAQRHAGARLSFEGVTVAMSLVVADGRVARIYAIANPNKLGRLETAVELKR